MLHTPDDFLKAIAATPADRTLRLVFADWLDEHSDPRAELIRIEEEMRALPAFSDRFWELKPRRNALRTLAGSEWCGHMRYGTECEPVFRHGIPDGWRDRWRLIREFTERWHRVPMPDVGGRQKEIAEAEARLGRELPLSVREWLAHAYDSRRPTENGPRPWNPYTDDGEYYARLSKRDRAVILAEDDEFYWGVRFADCDVFDPPVYFLSFGHPADEAATGSPPVLPVAESLTGYLLGGLTPPHARVDSANIILEDPSQLRDQLAAAFGPPARLGRVEVYEADNIFAHVSQRTLDSLAIVRICVRMGTDRAFVPHFLWDYTSHYGGSTGIFAGK
jgi:uncharacterized protein (TIGR02996 family)